MVPMAPPAMVPMNPGLMGPGALPMPGPGPLPGPGPGPVAPQAPGGAMPGVHGDTQRMAASARVLMCAAAQPSNTSCVPPVDSIAGMAEEAQPENKSQYVQKQQRWLLFLRHCAKCRANEQDCQLKAQCKFGKQLWQHILQCANPQVSKGAAKPGKGGGGLESALPLLARQSVEGLVMPSPRIPSCVTGCHTARC
jgi:E1A/CREB-binding protein